MRLASEDTPRKKAAIHPRTGETPFHCRIKQALEDKRKQLKKEKHSEHFENDYTDIHITIGVFGRPETEITIGGT